MSLYECSRCDRELDDSDDDMSVDTWPIALCGACYDHVIAEAKVKGAREALQGLLDWAVEYQRRTKEFRPDFPNDDYWPMYQDGVEDTCEAWIAEIQRRQADDKEEAQI